MKFLADQDVYAATIRFLQGLGHEVVQAAKSTCSAVLVSWAVGLDGVHDHSRCSTNFPLYLIFLRAVRISALGTLVPFLVPIVACPAS